MFFSGELNAYEVKVSNKYLVRLMMQDGAVIIESRENGDDRSWTGVLKGLNPKCLSWLMEMPRLIGRFLFVNPKTLEVVYSRGLLGGGSSPSRNMVTPISYTELNCYENIDPIKLEKNQKIAFQQAEKIVKAIEFGTFDMKAIKKLEAINPYECPNTYSIVNILFTKFYDATCWSSPIYSEQRAILARITRKHLFVHFMRNPDRAIFTNAEKKSMISNLNGAIEKVKQTLTSKPEIPTLLELNVMRRLIERANNTQRWWIKAIGVSLELFVIAKGIKKVNPVPILVGLHSLIDSFYKRSRGSYTEYLIILDAYEKYALSTDPGHSVEVEKFLESEFNRQNEHSWEAIYILLGFLEACIHNGKVSDDFLKNFPRYFTTLTIHKDWEIREKCARLLNVLRSHNNSEIQSMYEQSYSEILRNEKEEKVKIILRLPPLKKLDEIKKSSSLNNLRGVSDYIIGRDEEIQEIERRLNEKNILAICGIGGAGKSMLAVQYCKHFSHKFDIIWDIDSKLIRSNLTRLAEELGFEKKGDTVIELFSQLKSNNINKRILFLFDNIESEKDMENYYIDNPSIKFLITSRSQSWNNILQIKSLSIESSIKYLKHHLKIQNRTHLEKLAERINGWALGLKESVAIVQKNYTLSNFLKEYNEILSNIDLINRTLTERLTLLSEEANFLFDVIGCCNPKKIPERMLKAIMVESKGLENWFKARAQLVNYFIVSVDEDSQLWSLHDLIANIVNSKKKDEFAADAIIKYLLKKLKVEESFHINKETAKKLIELLPHAEQLIESKSIKNDDAIEILKNCGESYYTLNFDFVKIKRCIKKLKIIDIKNEFQEEKKAYLKYVIGNNYFNITNYKKAELFYLQCLNIRKQILPENHPNMAEIFNSLGNLYRNSADYDKAESFYLQCLNIRNQILPENHPYLAAIFMGLGNLYSEKTDYDKAESFYLQCLNIRKQILPESHPDLAPILNCLGNLYRYKADFDKAESFYLQCLNIYKQILPENHPDLATIFMNFGLLYSDKTDKDQAESFYVQCFNIRKQVLSKNHPELARILMNLRLLNYDKADYGNSELLYQSYLNIHKQILPENHPDMAAIFNSLGNFYRSQADYDKAESFYLQCFNIKKRILPENHPNFAAIFMNFGLLYSDKADYDKAESFYFKCLNIRKQILPENHPDLAAIFMGLGNLYRNKGNYDKAELFYLQCLNIFKQSLPKNHPDLANIHILLENLRT